jgi:hypothetical protein
VAEPDTRSATRRDAPAAGGRSPPHLGCGGAPPGGLANVALRLVLGPRTLLKILPIRWITRIAAAVMVTLSALSVVALVVE